MPALTLLFRVDIDRRITLLHDKFVRRIITTMDNSQEKLIEAYEQYGDAIFRHCYLRVFDRELAKDLVQEAFVRTWKYIMAGHTIENMRAFLYRTARNLIIDESRKKRPVSLDLLQEKGVVFRRESRNELMDNIDAKQIMELFSELDDIYREVLEMRYVEELAVKEIAEIVGESENTISVRIHRALQKIRDIVGQKTNPT